MTRDAQRRTRPDSGCVVLPCDELAPTLAFFVERLGFRVERIAPADDPRTAELSGHGLRLQLCRGHDGPAPTLRVPADALVGAPAPADETDDADAPDAPDARAPRVLSAPNGARIELVDAAANSPRAASLPTAPVLDRGDAPGAWVSGRAGMRYRDLIPGRAGGHLIASRIQISDGGPVPDSVHHHAVRAQVIYCVAGWVRVVYEDQGPAFVLSPGDLVLQPPGIRHRVLEASDGLEVFECASPAAHDTWFDHELTLPTGLQRPDHLFGGQQFVRHIAAHAHRGPCPATGLDARDTGVAAATAERASVRVLRAPPSDRDASAPGPARDGTPTAGATLPSDRGWAPAGDELVVLHVLAGTLTLSPDGQSTPLQLGPRDTLCLPPDVRCALGATSPELELLELRVTVGD